MAWTNPRTWVPREPLTAALLNLHLKDNLVWLRDRLGVASGGVAVRGASYITLAGSEVVATNSSGIGIVACGVTFTALPVVVVCNGDANVGAADDMAISSRSTTGFAVRCSATSTNIRVNWIAVGPV